MRAHEIMTEKFARKNEIAGILSNPDILMGFECEGVAYNRSYQNIVDAMMNDEAFEDMDPGDPDFQQIIADHVEEQEGFNTRSILAKKLEQFVQVRCKAYDIAPENIPADHSRNFMDYSAWGIVADGSIKGEGVPVEIVSSVYSLSAGLQKLERTFAFMAESNIATNDTTGLHVTMSIRGKNSRDYDFFKMAMFYDERGVAKLFDRENNFFSQMIKSKLKGFTNRDFSDLVQNQREFFKIIQILKAEGDWFRSYFAKEKYYSIRPKSNGLFEFRMIGGADYDLRYPDVRTQIINMANIMLIGADDSLHADEYVKKVVALIDQNKFEPAVQQKPIDVIRNVVKKHQLIHGREEPMDDKTIRKLRYEILRQKLRNAFTKDDPVDTYINTKIIPSTPSQADQAHPNKSS